MCVGGIPSCHIGMWKNPTNTRHRPNAVSILVHRLRRWTKTEPALGQCLVLAGNGIRIRDACRRLRWWGEYNSNQYSWNQCWLNVRAASLTVDQYEANNEAISGTFWHHQPWPVTEVTVQFVNLLKPVIAIIDGLFSVLFYTNGASTTMTHPLQGNMQMKISTKLHSWWIDLQILPHWQF